MADINGVRFSGPVKEAKEFLRGLDKNNDLTLDADEIGAIQYKIDGEEVGEQRDAFVAMKTQKDAVQASHDTKEIGFFGQAIGLVIQRLTGIGAVKDTTGNTLPEGIEYDEDVKRAKALLETYMNADGSPNIAKINGQVDVEDVDGDRRSLYLAILQKADAIKTSSNPEEVTRLDGVIKAVTARLEQEGFARQLVATKDAPSVPLAKQASPEPAQPKKKSSDGRTFWEKLLPGGK